MIAAIAGDVIQNLRSSLDHIAYQAVCIGLGKEPSDPKRAAYPIAEDAASYPSLRAQRLNGASQKAIDAIDATRPYKGGNDTLWRVNRLNNIDKHRLLLTVGSAYRHVNIAQIRQSVLRKSVPDWAQKVSIAPIRIKPADRMFPLKAGDELFIDLIEHDPQHDMDFGFDVAISEPQVIESESLVEALGVMVNTVEGLLPGFAEVLD